MKISQIRQLLKERRKLVILNCWELARQPEAIFVFSFLSLHGSGLIESPSSPALVRVSPVQRLKSVSMLLVPKQTRKEHMLLLRNCCLGRRDQCENGN